MALLPVALMALATLLAVLVLWGVWREIRPGPERPPPKQEPPDADADG